jgi:uncharacterized membrane protein
MSLQVSVTIDAPAERVWSELINVERWPLFTDSMTSVERLDRGPFQNGSRARIKQPSLPSMVWTVTNIQPLHQFTWTVTSAGVTTVATHALSPGPAGSVILTLSIDRTGVLAPVIDMLTAGLTRRYVTMEAEGMKRACEVGSAATAA